MLYWFINFSVPIRFIIVCIRRCYEYDTGIRSFHWSCAGHCDPFYHSSDHSFIFVLQQFDGNILGPLILGDKLGLPSIGILFSVCVGGGLFGIIGMFIGVPCFAVIYAAVREFVNYRLKQKKLSLEQLSFQAQKDAKQKEEEFEEIIRDDE